MSKQDGTAPRTAADLERKYKFGQSFAEVYGLVEEAQRAAEEAKSSIGELDQETIFNLLTNFGQNKGVYRDENGELYVNASYIKSGELTGANLKVDAATIHGKLIATQVDIKDLEVNAAKVTGKLTSAEIDANKITGGTLDFAKVTAKNLEVDYADIGGLKVGVVEIIEDTVNADYVHALGIYATELECSGDNSYETIYIADGMISFKGGYLKNYGRSVVELHSPGLRLTCDELRIGTESGGYWMITGSGIYHYTASGDQDNEVVLKNY